MTAMTHTFLFEEGVWRTTGSFVDAEQHSFSVEGSSRVRHERHLWRLAANMQIATPKAVDFSNDYEIRPFAAGAAITSWTSTNPDLGRLNGEFTIVGDSILSSFQSPGGVHRGTEALIQRAPDLYEARGFLANDGKLMSSWCIELRRQENPE